MVTQQEAQQFADANHVTYIEASAKTGLNVDKCFLDAAKTIMTNIENQVYDLANEVKCIQNCGIKVSHALLKGNMQLQKGDGTPRRKRCSC